MNQRRPLELALTLALVFFMVVGCAGTIDTTQQAKEVSKWAGDITEAKRVLYKDNWFRLSGLVRGYFGPNLATLPGDTISVINELDKLMLKDPLTDYDVWYACGSMMRAANPVIKEWADRMMPYFGRDLVSLLRFVGWV